jgi:hypothetical protein
VKFSHPLPSQNGMPRDTVGTEQARCTEAGQGTTDEHVMGHPFLGVVVTVVAVAFLELLNFLVHPMAAIVGAACAPLGCSRT